MFSVQFDNLELTIKFIHKIINTKYIFLFYKIPKISWTSQLNSSLAVWLTVRLFLFEPPTLSRFFGLGMSYFIKNSNMNEKFCLFIKETREENKLKNIEVNLRVFGDSQNRF